MVSVMYVNLKNIWITGRIDYLAERRLCCYGSAAMYIGRWTVGILVQLPPMKQRRGRADSPAVGGRHKTLRRSVVVASCRSGGRRCRSGAQPKSTPSAFRQFVVVVVWDGAQMAVMWLPCGSGGGGCGSGCRGGCGGCGLGDGDQARRGAGRQRVAGPAVAVLSPLGRHVDDGRHAAAVAAQQVVEVRRRRRSGSVPRWSGRRRQTESIHHAQAAHVRLAVRRPLHAGLHARPDTACQQVRRKWPGKRNKKEEHLKIYSKRNESSTGRGGLGRLVRRPGGPPRQMLT